VVSEKRQTPVVRKERMLDRQIEESINKEVDEQKKWVRIQLDEKLTQMHKKQAASSAPKAKKLPAEEKTVKVAKKPEVRRAVGDLKEFAA